ncbi:hydrolase [Nocardia donostiensis]|uniref:alpha/beta hydrolase n=1 Tax=Nocardia donostiensis TaxID=1538463 RepID=UPI0009D9D4BF|nr:alpha/beta fold hydrolase [Nocardia donostiensis]OQS13654.1 hydrolase [Nocardia donostiensis]
MRWTRAVVLASALSIMIAGCGAGPSDRPGVAVERPPVPGGATTTDAVPAPPRPGVPKTDLSWHPCTQPTFDQFGLGPAPAGLVLDCAEYSTPIDASGSVLGSFRTAAVRARLPQTPADAAPLVLTSGADRPSAATLAGLSAGPASALLAAHPIVAVDRRGIGGSQAIDCLPDDIRRGLHNNGQFAPGGDPVAAMTEFSQDGTIACRDFLQPYDGTFDTAHAADDIEQLRKQWQVDHIALLGTGNGALVALNYARKFGDHLARLILDSPVAVNADAVTRAEQRVQGAEAALTAFAQRCVGVGCALGPDPRAVVTSLVGKAAAGDLGDISANALLTAVTGFLGSPRADQAAQVAELADALAAADRGDRGGLTALIRRETAATASDGQFVNGCTDTQQPPAPAQAADLAKAWGEKYPVFGRAAAISLLTCSAWPANPAQPALEDLELPVLVLAGVADPVAGAGQASVTGVLGTAGARHATVNWQGWGHPVSAHSGCAQQAVIDYLNEAKLPADGTACPA